MDTYNPAFDVLVRLLEQGEVSMSAVLKTLDYFDAQTYRFVNGLLKKKLIATGLFTLLGQIEGHAHVEVVKMVILNEHIDPSSENNYAVRRAVEFGYTDVVGRLLKDNRIYFSAVRGDVVFRLAIRYGRVEILRRFINVINEPLDGFGCYDAIADAVVWNQLDVLKFLISCNYDPSGRDNEAIQTAAKNNRVEMAKLLLADKRVDPSANNNAAIRKAAARGHAEIVRLLLADPRVDPGANHNAAIQKAAARGHAETVRLLLADKRVHLDACNDIFIQAVKQNHIGVVEALLADGRVNPDECEIDLIRCASKKGHAEILQLLLRDGRENIYGSDAIQVAVENNRPQIVALLLANKRCNPSCDYQSAIRDAILGGHTAIIDLLMADDRIGSVDGIKSIINYTTKYNHGESRAKIFQYILERRAMIFSQKGDTKVLTVPAGALMFSR